MNDEVPPEDLVVKLIDYRYELSKDLRKGVQVLRIETPGPSMHEMDIFRLHPGKTVADLRQWRKNSGPGPAPFDSLGGALDSHDIRRVVWLRRDFSPGRYLFHCEMPLTANAQTTNQESHARGPRDGARDRSEGIARRGRIARRAGRRSAQDSSLFHLSLITSRSERFFKKISALGPQQQPDFPRVLEIARKYGLEILPPPTSFDSTLQG